MPANDLIPYIFANMRLPLAGEFARWVQESPRFRVFAEAYRDKIRRKVRGITDAEGYRDLQAEFATAYFLVQERRFLVEYEKYGTGKQRGPDFSVTYKTHVRFDVEVTRLRGLNGAQAEEGPALQTGKFVNTLCAKLQQLPPSMTNVLVLAADSAPDKGEDGSSAGLEETLASGLRGAVALLQERAERKDDDFFARRGFLGARDFARHYNRLSAVRLVAPGAPPVLWLQPQARHPLSSDLANLLRR